MHALDTPLFPNCQWGSMVEYESYNVVGDKYHSNDTFLDFPVPKTVHHQPSLGVSVPSERNGTDNDSVMIKKLNHNANERNRRKKINYLFSSLSSCLPGSNETVIKYLL